MEHIIATLINKRGEQFNFVSARSDDEQTFFDLIPVSLDWEALAYKAYTTQNDLTWLFNKYGF